ncbi:MAG TPA: histidine kinase, partial [Bryobacteraceae bacterium]
MLNSHHEPLLVNILGHTAGAVVFGIFLFLLLREGVSRARDSGLSILAAALSFTWNLGSLAALTMPPGHAADAIAALSFGSLSILPAVLLHIALDRKFPSIYGSGYALAAVALVMHVAELRFPESGFHRRGLILITIGFSGLTVAAAVSIIRSGQRRRLPRVLGTMCLALFAMSFVHFGTGESHAIWSSELFIHHAGLPLALFVLLQDHRFVLLDAFLRFLANVFLSALMTFAAFRAFEWVAARQHPDQSWLLLDASVLSGLCLLLILFAVLRSGLQNWLTQTVFRRLDLDAAVELIRTGSIAHATEEDFLLWATRKTAQLVEAEESALADADQVKPAWVETAVLLRIARSVPRVIWLGRRRGGRRYLSEDFAFLDHLAAAIAERVEEFHAVRMETLMSQAELRALQSQINPHFLFNALNTLYGVIPREAGGARRMVQNLADMFRYSLQSEGSLVSIERELQIVDAYLEIEQLRMGDRMKVEKHVDEVSLPVRIPVFTIQPLVENAMKHAIAANPAGGVLRLGVRMDLAADQVTIRIEDTGRGSGSAGGATTGVGLNNVRKRLELCFGPEA